MGMVYALMNEKHADNSTCIKAFQQILTITIHLISRITTIFLFFFSSVYFLYCGSLFFFCCVSCFREKKNVRRKSFEISSVSRLAYNDIILGFVECYHTHTHTKRKTKQKKSIKKNQEIYCM